MESLPRQCIEKLKDEQTKMLFIYLIVNNNSE